MLLALFLLFKRTYLLNLFRIFKNCENVVEGGAWDVDEDEDLVFGMYVLCF